MCVYTHIHILYTHNSNMIQTTQKPANSMLYVDRRSFKLWPSYTLKASLRRYSSLAISSATHPGISGMATWMMYFRRIAKCWKPSTTKGQTQHTYIKAQLHSISYSKRGRTYVHCRTTPTSSKTIEMMAISGLSQGNRRWSCPHWPIK